MKVYVVKAPQGEYEDYREPIVKVFADKKKAKQYVKEENDKLPLEQADKCFNCHYKWVMSFKPTQPIPNCLKQDKHNMCENYFKYRDVQKLFMEEYEVEE
jgi:hypothetical protein